MTLPIMFYCIAGISVLLTGMSKSGFGGGLGIMAVPLLSLFISPQYAVAILMPILLAMDIIVAWQYRNSWNHAVVYALLPGALLGLLIGAASYQWMDPNLVRFIIGILALSFVFQSFFTKIKTNQPSQATKTMVFSLGALSGFSSFIAHAGGPPVKGFLLKQNLEKSNYVGTNTMFFFSLNAVKTVTYGAMGHFNWEGFLVSATLSPMLIIGIVFGTKLHDRIDQSKFRSVVFFFLALTGIKLLWDSYHVWWVW